jgi:hypothetical protein
MKALLMRFVGSRAGCATAAACERVRDKSMKENREEA